MSIVRGIKSVQIQASNTPSIDSFGRWRTSDPRTLFDSKQVHSKQPLQWDDQETSGGGTSSTWSQPTASTVIGVSAETAGTRVRQTKRRFNYQPGKSQLYFFTGTLKSGGGAGITRCMGCYDDNNGLFFRDNEGTVQVVKRSSYANSNYPTSGSPTDTAVDQADWNLDPLDGTGPSGVTLDATKSQIGVITFEWLGVGTAAMGFVVDSQIIYVHQFLHANRAAGVYMSTPNVPMRYEITNDGTGAASELEHICCTVMSEGGIEPSGAVRNAYTAAVTSLANTGSIYAIIGIRQKAANLDSEVDLLRTSLCCGTTNDLCQWMLIRNPTVAGTFTYSDQANSVMQVATGAATNTVTGGVVVDSGFFSTTAPSSSAIIDALKFGALIDGTVDELVLCAKPITNNISVYGSMTWQELS